jgi:hypothetical protein
VLNSESAKQKTLKVKTERSSTRALFDWSAGIPAGNERPREKWTGLYRQYSGETHRSQQRVRQYSGETHRAQPSMRETHSEPQRPADGKKLLRDKWLGETEIIDDWFSYCC